MVNGNDLLEFEEEHIQLLEETFANNNSFNGYVLANYPNIFEEFKENFEELWNEFVENEYNNWRAE